MRKLIWLVGAVVVVGLALALWGGVVFGQEPAKTPAPNGNWTAMADYCRGLMDGTPAVASINWTEMHNYCQNASGMMGTGGMMGGGMMDMMMDMMHGGGMMNGGGMMGSGGMMHGGAMGK